VMLPKLMELAGTKVPPPFWYQRVRLARSDGSSALPALLLTVRDWRMSALLAAMDTCSTRFPVLFCQTLPLGTVVSERPVTWPGAVRVWVLGLVMAAAAKEPELKLKAPAGAWKSQLSPGKAEAEKSTVT